MIYSSCLPVLLLLYAAHSMVMNNITFKINQLMHDKQTLNRQIETVQSTYSNHHCDTYLLLQQNQSHAKKTMTLQKNTRQLLMHLSPLTPAGCQINQLTINDKQIEWQLHARHMEDIALYRRRIQSLSFISDIAVSTLQQSPNQLDQYQATLMAQFSAAKE